MNDCEANLDKLFPFSAHDRLNDVWVRNLFDKHSTLGEFDGAADLKASGYYETDGCEEVASILESLWCEKHIDCTIAFAQCKKCLHLVHLLRLHFLLNHSSLCILNLDHVSLPGSICLNPVHFPHGVRNVARINGSNRLAIYRILRLGPTGTRVI
jgi:hypothetical protein